MADKKIERTTVDLTERKERIERLRPDSAWKALSWSRKISLLLDEYLDLLEKQQLKPQKEVKPKSSAVDTLLKKLLAGEQPTDDQIVLVAGTLKIETEQLMDFCDRVAEVWDGNDTEEEQLNGCG